MSGLTLTEWGIVVGIITALLTFAANIIYQHRRDRRERNLAELQERLIYRDVAREVEQ